MKEWDLAELQRELFKLFTSHIDEVFEEHRLAYVFRDGSEGDDEVFVCACDDGFGSSSGFNTHLKAKLKESRDG